MSETSQGAGWWQASDGRWYPPQLHPMPPPPWEPPPPYSQGARHTNGFAIASLVLSLVGAGIGSVLAVIFGVMARREIRASRGSQDGDGLAVAGLIIGWIGIGVMVAAIALVATLAADGRLNSPDSSAAAPAISGAPGYTTSTGDHGLPLAEGQPWGRPCQPVVFQVSSTMPDAQYDLIRQTVLAARSAGLDVTIETRDRLWYPDMLYPPGQDSSTVEQVPIFSSPHSPSRLSNGQPQHLGFSYDTTISSDRHHEQFTDLQGVIYLDAVRGDPQATERSVRQLIAFSQGVTDATAPGSSISSGNTQDAYSTQDMAAMQLMSGCTFEPTAQPSPGTA